MYGRGPRVRAEICRVCDNRARDPPIRVPLLFPGNAPLFFPRTEARPHHVVWMRRSLGPLLCELHAHSRWSDGELPLSELVDLHGRAGFDVLCVTDHVVRRDDPWRAREGIRFRSVDETSWDNYLAEIEREAARARKTYGMLVVPGLELTFNDEEPSARGTCVESAWRGDRARAKLRLRRPGIAEIETAPGRRRDIAAHPYGDEPAHATRALRSASRATRSCAGSSTASSCSTVRSSSAGSPSPGFQRLRPEISIAPSISRDGRRCFRVSTTSRLSSTTSARHAPSTSPVSTSSYRAWRPEHAVAFATGEDPRA